MTTLHGGARRRPTTAAELAARIQIPRRLPVRYDGQPLQHLSHSSYTRFLLCPDDWRRHYLRGERTPPSAAMFLGGRVDDALSTYYRQLLEHGQTLSLDQLHDAYRDHWTRELAAEQAKRGVTWDDELDEPRRLRRSASRRSSLGTRGGFVPQIGRPVAIQRRLEYQLAADLEWTIQCYLDLETLRHRQRRRRPRRGDRRLQGQEHAAFAGQGRRRPPGEPLPRRPLARRRPGARVLLRADRQARQRDASRWAPAFVTTRRSVGQLRAMLARIAQAASQIVAPYERYGPDEPWGFADPSGWKCCARYCSHHRAAPAGAGSERSCSAPPKPTPPRWCNEVMFRRVLAVLVLVLVAVVAIRLVVGLVVGLVSAVMWILVIAALVAAGLWARSTLKSGKRERSVKRGSSPDVIAGPPEIRWRLRCAASPSSCASMAAADGQ